MVPCEMHHSSRQSPRLVFESRITRGRACTLREPTYLGSSRKVCSLFHHSTVKRFASNALNLKKHYKKSRVQIFLKLLLGVMCLIRLLVGPVNLKVVSYERVLPWQVTMDQLICASLFHTHYWYEVGISYVNQRILDLQ